MVAVAGVSSSVVMDAIFACLGTSLRLVAASVWSQMCVRGCLILLEREPFVFSLNERGDHGRHVSTVRWHYFFLG